MKSEFECPNCPGNFFVETDSPFINGDWLDCPVCGDGHIISGSFSGGPVNRYAVHKAFRHHFKFARSDRDALEFYATSRTQWDKGVSAYAIGDCIFWPSKRAASNRRIKAHEQCHVRQSRKYGPLRFTVKYWFEQARKGYEKNKYERSAQRAERRT